jgi:hypothetical protein
MCASSSSSPSVVKFSPNMLHGNSMCGSCAPRKFVVLGRTGVHSLQSPAVIFELVAWRVAIPIRPPEQDRARGATLEDSRPNFAAPPNHRARQPHVQGDNSTIARSFRRSGRRFDYSVQSRTAAPLMRSLLRSFRARLASRRGKAVTCVRMGIAAAMRRKSLPSWRVLLATLRMTRS